jgi:cytolysin (calcineurin-like family phosphatase)
MSRSLSARSLVLRRVAIAAVWPGLWLACSAGKSAGGNASPPGADLGGRSAAAGAGGQAVVGASGSVGSAGVAAGNITTGSAGYAGGVSSSGGAANGAGAGGAGASAGQSGGAGGMSGKTPLDVTFFVVADTHADPVPSDDLLATARAVNAVAQSGTWPTQISGQDTHFKGGPIGKPRGVAFVGDLTGWGTAPTEIPTFRHYFEAGNSPDSISFPAYLGLGNHDVDTADRTADLATQYRNLEWAYIDSRHLGPTAPVPVTSFDPASHNYSFDFAGVHLIQTHRFAGDVEYGLASSLSWLASDLKKYASDGRPVFVLHHYGMDAFGTGTNPVWWTDNDRAAYRNTLKGYHVSAVIVGHTHAAFNYSWQGLRVFQVNNAKAENGTGNNDGNGSFAIVRVTKEQVDVVTCRWLDDTGRYELIGPYFSGPTDVGAVP